MPAPAQLPHISPAVLRFFRLIVRRYFRRHFRSVMAQGADHLRSVSGPLIVYGNHSSWWDPMLIVLLGHLLLPGRQHYAPIDAEALKRYPILKRLGIFPVELNSPRGAANFLRTASAILQANGVLWLTPQGRFVDPRVRPLGFKPGLAALALRQPQVPLIPLAVEYTFWDERLPETLLHAGAPLHINPQRNTADTTTALETALETCMNALQQSAISRDPTHFQILFSGARGTGGVYGLIRRFTSLLRGAPPQLDHTRRHDS